MGVESILSIRHHASWGRVCAAALAGTLVVSPAPIQAQTQAPPYVGSAPGGIGAQPRVARPYRGLFGGGVGNTAQRLTLETSVGGGFSSGSPSGRADELGEASQHVGGATLNLNGKLEYLLNREKIAMNSVVTTAGELDPVLERMLPRHTATLSVTYIPTSTTNITVSQGFKNVPEFSASDVFGPDLGGIVPPVQDVGLTVERYKRYGVNAEMTQKITQRSRVDAGFGWGHGVISTGVNWTIRSYYATFTQGITRGAGVYVGYRYGDQSNPGPNGDNIDRHPTINFGLDYGRPLSLTRRTTMSFSTGISQMRDQVQNRTSNQLVGSIAVAREFGRTWSLGTSFSRGAQYVESLATPMFNDTFRISVKGSFSERLQFASGLGLSKGQFGSTGEGGSAFDSIFGSAQLSMALNRYLNLGTDYSYSRMAGGIPLTSGERVYPHAIRGYVQLWMPLLNRTKNR